MKNQRQDLLSQTIPLLLSLEILLIGLQAQIQIEQGKSSLEVLRWAIQQSIPVLVRIRSMKNKQDKNKWY